MKIKEIRCQIIKVAVLGLFSLLLVNCQQNDNVATKRPRVKNTSEAVANVEQANSSNSQISTSPSSNTENTTSPVSNTESLTQRSAAKPLNCDKKCNTVYDQCMADFRQFGDVEQICKGKETTCIKNCSASVPQVKAKTADGVGKCDDRCFKAKDQCEAEFRQFPDVEEICSKKLTTCLGKCP